MGKGIFFDLFFTLIVPKYDSKVNEYNLLNMTPEEWERYAEDELLYNERALGKVKDEKEIIDKIISTMPATVGED